MDSKQATLEKMARESDARRQERTKAELLKVLSKVRKDVQAVREMVSGNTIDVEFPNGNPNLNTPQAGDWCGEFEAIAEEIFWKACLDPESF